jgi:membrane-associated HD superfamily phosphohydrolase
MFDFIKRARLQRQGLSCGRVRRKQLQGEIWETLRCNPLVGAGTLVLSWLGVLTLLRMLSANSNAASAGSSVFVTAVLITAAVQWYLGFQHERRNNSQIVLTFAVIAVHLAATGLVLNYALQRSVDAGFALMLAPHALAPTILCMLAGRRLGLYAAVYATLLGASLVEDTYALPFVATGFGVGFTAVFASQRVRRRSRLLTCGFYAGLAATAYMLLFGQAQVAMGTGWEMLLLAASPA